MIIGHTVEHGGIIRNLIFSFHIPLFFIVSGYTFRAPESIKELGRKLKKDLKHIYLPCLITACLFEILRAIADSNQVEGLEIVKRVLWGNGCSYTWNNCNFAGVYYA